MSNSLLLIALMLLVLAHPFFPAENLAHVVFLVTVSTVLVGAIWAVSRQRRVLVASLSLAAPTFTAAWLQHFIERRWLTAVYLVLGALFLGFTAVVVLRQTLEGAAVTTDTIAGAICFYILLGVIWALIYALIELTHPGSFLDRGHPVGSAGHHSLVPELLYLSLVTLSTVGYGDILPITQQARMLAAVEGIIGPLYLAVLITRLVSLASPRPSPSA